MIEIFSYTESHGEVTERHREKNLRQSAKSERETFLIDRGFDWIKLIFTDNSVVLRVIKNFF